MTLKNVQNWRCSSYNPALSLPLWDNLLEKIGNAILTGLTFNFILRSGLKVGWFLPLNAGVRRESICVPSLTIYQDLVRTEGTGMD